MFALPLNHTCVEFNRNVSFIANAPMMKRNEHWNRYIVWAINTITILNYHMAHTTVRTNCILVLASYVDFYESMCTNCRYVLVNSVLLQTRRVKEKYCNRPQFCNFPNLVAICLFEPRSGFFTMSVLVWNVFVTRDVHCIHNNFRMQP